MFDKDEQEISQIIDDGVEALLSGSATLEEILAKYPDQADAIRPELETANWLFSHEEQVKPRPGFVPASRKRVVDRIKREASEGSAKHAFFGFSWPKQLALRWMAIVMIVVMLLSSTGGLVSASQSTLPGDGLYSIKRLSEEISYNLTFNSVDRVKYNAKLADRRMDELAALISSGKVGDIQPVLREFERQVNRTVALLQTMSNGQSQEQRDLAVVLHNDLNKHAETLEKLTASAPSDLRTTLEETKKAALLGASTADNVSKGSKAAGTATPAPTFTLTLTPADTATMVTVDTPAVNNPSDYLPTNANGRGTDLAAQPTDEPDSTLTPAGNSQNDNPGKSVKPAKTPNDKSNNANANSNANASGQPANNGNASNNDNSNNNNANPNADKDKTKDSKK